MSTLLIFAMVGIAAPAGAGGLPSPWVCAKAYDTSCVSFSGYAGQSNAFLDGWGTPVTENGNNCTNYVAYRLASAGYEHHLEGNARDWDDYAAVNSPLGLSISSSAAAASIAQWDATESNSYGHVAWVDHVSYSSDGSVDSIWISESAWASPGYSQRRVIDAGSGDWPSNFIHVDGVTEAGGDEVWGLSSDGAIFRLGPNDQWVHVPGTLASLTVDQSGVAYGLAASGAIFKYNGTGGWTNIPGALSEIEAGGDEVWGLSSDGAIFRLGPNDQWVHVPGTLASLTVDQSGVAYGLAASGAIFKYNGTGGWTNIPGALSEIEAGGDEVWGLSSDGAIFRLGPNDQWVHVPGTLASLTVSE